MGGIPQQGRGTSAPCVTRRSVVDISSENICLRGACHECAHLRREPGHEAGHGRFRSQPIATASRRGHHRKPVPTITINAAAAEPPSLSPELSRPVGREFCLRADPTPAGVPRVARRMPAQHARPNLRIQPVGTNQNVP